MKKRIILAGIFVYLVFFYVSGVNAQTECVFGLENDPAPGSCGSYIDRDGNDLCDLSEVPLENHNGRTNVPTLSEEELKAKTVKEVAEVYGIETSLFREELSKYLNIDVKGADSMLDLHDNNGLCTGVAGNIALALKAGRGVENVEDHDLISGEEVKMMKVYEVAEVYGIKSEDLVNALSDFLGKNVKLTERIELYHDNFGLEAHKVKEIAAKLAEESNVGFKKNTTLNDDIKTGPRYKSLPITVTLVILYLITYILVKEKKITLLTHRRIWNTILLFSFLASIALGILLIMRINQGWSFNLPFNMLYWHVELGTVMAVVTFFHLTWHWKFYTCILKRKKKKECID